MSPNPSIFLKNFPKRQKIISRPLKNLANLNKFPNRKSSQCVKKPGFFRKTRFFLTFFPPPALRFFRSGVNYRDVLICKNPNLFSAERQ